jgi:hypothetical protein
MVIGSVFFGLVAQWTVVSVSLLVGGFMAICGLVLFWRFPVFDES